MTTKIIAHRGASAYAKENTLEAFSKAIEMKAQMIEFDVRKTEDGKFIVFHNESIDGKSISGLEYCEIKKLNPKILTLEEALVFCKGKIGLDIELKESGDENEITGIILQNIETADFLITFFDPSSLKKIKTINPEIRTGLIIGKKFSFLRLAETFREIFPFGTIKEIGADFLVAHKSFLVFDLVRRAFRQNVPLIVWGVNKKKLAKDLILKNIEGIITNYPDIMLKK